VAAMGVSANTKNGDTVYVYTMKSTGEVMERVGIVSRKHRGAALMLVTFNGGQRLCLSSKAGEIHNNTMWSREPMRNVYIMKMIDILLDRKAKYEERIASTNRRLQVLKECGRRGI